MNDEDRAEIRKMIEEALKSATSKKGLVIQRVGTPLSKDELRDDELNVVAGGVPKSPPTPGDQCCNGCD
jgi:hypothetical protein